MAMSERKNRNRGFKQLRVWKEAIELFVFINEGLKVLPYDLNKSKMNTLDACHSIQRNIAEGFCRRSAKEYLNFLNIALASCGELNSSVISFNKAGFITDEIFEEFDIRHFKLENGMIKLAASLQAKIKNKDWDDSYA
jgi:four helix bundle protein